MPQPVSENPDDDAQALEHGRRLFAQACDFVIGAASVDASGSLFRFSALVLMMRSPFAR